MIPLRLLDVAIDRFGRLGFEGASTRDIARASGTAMSSITYHFGGKEGLYLAAAEHIGNAISERQAKPLAAARAAAEGSREAAVEALLAVIDSMAQMMLGDESAPWARFIMREQQAPTQAFERLWSGAMRPIAETCVGLVARARPDLDDREARATALLLFGQAMILRAGRASACRVLGLEALDDEAATLLRARIRANALCILSETPR
jgi:TetR/AcrR family transcriptional regulator, regulator of cefoperazone and chloramphenicol sensitivity